MSVVLIGLGVAAIALVLFDVFASVLVPRPVPSRLLVSAFERRFAWHWWRTLFFAIEPPQRREIILGSFAPLSVVVLLVSWLIGLVAGYGLIFYGLASQIRPHPASFWEAAYFAGTSLLTLGFGDIVGTGAAARAISLAAGATGIATVAVVLSFLFSLFNSYRQRELFEITLDARAGAPPSGVALLETHAQLDIIDDLPRFFEHGQNWCAEVLETHLAYPVLCYFRSTHVGMSWVGALGAMLDAATLVISAVKGVPKGQAQLMHSVGSHLVYDVAHYFRLLGPELTLVEQHEFITAHERLGAAGYSLEPQAESWQTFCRLRTEYASSLNNLARHWAIEPAPWIGDRSPLEGRRD